MIRDLARLANEAFDVVVIGGGIYGLAAARELVARGLAVALVECGDFVSGTSFNSLKTVHGGIRALQHGALPAMREFVRERRGFATIAPHLVRPLPFVVPTYRHPLRNRAVMSAFLFSYDLLAFDRNKGVHRRLALPRSRTISRDECLRLSPAIDPTGVTGGAVWHDYQLHSPERLAIALLAAAVKNGAVAANYTEARGFVQQAGRIHAVRLRNRLSGTDLEVRCRFVLNAAGPWAWPFLQEADVVPAAPPPAMSLAMNLVVDRPAAPCAAGGLADGRFLFLVPWRDRSMIGTSHESFSGRSDALAVTRSQVDALLTDAAKAFPGAGVGAGDVRLVHRGLLPAHRGAELLKESVMHDHASEGLTGLVTVVGVRYTTARATAAMAAEHIARRLGKPPGTRLPSREPVAGGDIADVEGYEAEQIRSTTLPGPLIHRLVAAYGRNYDAVARLIRETPDFAARLSQTCPVTRAEVVYAVRQEMAIHLSDVLLRRTDAGTAGHPGHEAVRTAASVMAAELGWTAVRMDEEITAFNRTYVI